MSKTRVAVLRGGPSSEYEVSLKTGAAVLSHLPQDKYESREVFISRDGYWHVRGMQVEPAHALQSVDVAFVALHGKYGEDGTLQRLLERFSVPYTGSGPLASAISMNKVLAKERVAVAGVQTALHHVLTREVTERGIISLFGSFPQPSVIKPLDGGSSVGVVIARDYHTFLNGILDAFAHGDQVLVEEYIPGVEATVGVVEQFRGEEHYALPPIEIVPKDRTFFDYEAKYGGASDEICPARFLVDTNKVLEELARTVHRALGLRHYSRSDFIVSPRGIYFLEVNTLPGLTETSLIPKAVGAVGAKFPDFLDHLITLALSRR